jgi:hypothetical protein
MTKYHPIKDAYHILRTYDYVTKTRLHEDDMRRTIRLLIRLRRLMFVSWALSTAGAVIRGTNGVPDVNGFVLSGTSFLGIALFSHFIVRSRAESAGHVRNTLIYIFLFDPLYHPDA